MPKASEKKKKTEKEDPAKSPPKKSARKKAAKPKESKTAKTRREIKTAMIDALKKKGADTALYMDQIEKYMDLWDMYILLAEDVKTNGLRFATTTPSGQTIIKENPSVKNLPAVNKQMIMQLKMMDLLDFEAMAIPEVSDEL